jgi:ribose transport system permease protein
VSTSLVEGGLLGFLVILIIGFSVGLPSLFFTTANFQLILQTQAIPIILALAVTLPLLAGEFDLSVAANLGVCSVFTAYTVSHGWPVGLTFIVVLFIGAAIGTLNGVLVVKIGVNAFVATLGVSTLLSGGNLLMTGGGVIFQGIGSSLTNIARTQFLGLSAVVYYALGVALVLWYLIEWTPFGRYMLATGKGRLAANLSGIRTNRWLFISFLLAGVLSAACGFLETAQVGSAGPAVGPDFLLPAYAAAFLGATTIHAGRFNIWGTVVGSLILAVGITGLDLLGVAAWVAPVFNGGALIVAVSASVIVNRRASTRL